MKAAKKINHDFLAGWCHRHGNLTKREADEVSSFVLHVKCPSLSATLLLVKCWFAEIYILLSGHYHCKRCGFFNIFYIPLFKIWSQNITCEYVMCVCACAFTCLSSILYVRLYRKLFRFCLVFYKYSHTHPESLSRSMHLLRFTLHYFHSQFWRFFLKITLIFM